MAPPTLVPDKTTLRRLIDDGYTHAQIGVMYGVTREAISGAARRYGLSSQRSRHDDTLPWKVRAVHAMEYPARMLRLLGRRRKGSAMNAAEASELDGWLAKLERDGTIVAYQPSDEQFGFKYIPVKYKDHDEDVPIRRKALREGS
jgi:hypothetical protein